NRAGAIWGRAVHNKAVRTASRSRSCGTACAPIRQGDRRGGGTILSSRAAVCAEQRLTSDIRRYAWLAAVAEFQTGAPELDDLRAAFTAGRRGARVCRC